jgi:peptidyl-dipeptidase Dcp
MQRPAVWPVLTRAESRALRERVFRLWDSRGNNRGRFDNVPVMTEILQLRGEKARLLGHPTYAHYATASRMAGTPEVAERMLMRTWNLLLPTTREHLAELQALAKAEGAEFQLAPWDRLYYAERYRQQRFGFDPESVRPYLTLANVMAGMTWAAERVYGISLRELKGVPTVAPEVRVYEALRGTRTVGVLYVDIFQRKGKGPASWATEQRPAERGDREVLPIATLHSNVVRPADGSEPLLAWEIANVIFHEFGHAMHMLANGARYRALGSLHVPYDFIETPSLLQERWLLDRELLTRFMRHHRTGEPMPAELVDRIERVHRHDRVFSVNLDFLATALVDHRMHRLADGRAIDAVAVERDVLDTLGMPAAITPLLRVAHAPHPFTDLYGGAVYTYLWSDALAADIAEKFLAAPGGLYDPEVSALYRSTILEAGNTRPMDEAFRAFRGRDPDPDALFRRFGLLPPKDPARAR